MQGAEANPDVFVRLRDNRASLCLNQCVGETVGTVEFTQVSGWAEMHSGITSALDPRQQARIDAALPYRSNPWDEGCWRS